MNHQISKRLNKLKQYYIDQSFTINIISILFNPFYFSRKGLYKGIKKNSHHMQGVMLDFGCGRKPYKNILKVDKYVGLDMENEGHDHKNEQIDVYYDGKTIPFTDNFFDSVFTSEVFEHVPDLDETLLEINRVLKKDGNILITIPFVWDEHEIPNDYRRLTSYGITRILNKHNFEVIKLTKSTTYIETIYQMFIAYLYQEIFSSFNFLKLFFVIFINPFLNIFGIVLNLILPKSQKFYHNNIVLAKKIK